MCHAEQSVDFSDSVGLIAAATLSGLHAWIILLKVSKALSGLTWLCSPLLLLLLLLQLSSSV